MLKIVCCCTIKPDCCGLPFWLTPLPVSCPSTTPFHYKDNEEIEAGCLKVVFEQVFYEDSFKRGRRTSSNQSVYMLI